MSSGHLENTKIGEFVVEEVLGDGAFGVVVKARDPGVQRSVAIKKLKKPEGVVAGDRRVDTIDLFGKEAQAIGSLSHPNIVTVYGFNTDKADNAPFLVMEFIEGQTLEQLIRRFQKSGDDMPLAEKLDIMQQVAEGLQFAHTRGVTHRDIKPANIMLLPDGTAKVLDFAVAPEGILVGTPAYMAPEQFEGQGSDALTDVFGYGAVFFELLTLKRAFDPATPQRAQNSGYKPPAVSGFVASCPAWLDNVVASLMEARKERTESLEEMLVFTRPQLRKIKEAYAADLAQGISRLSGREKEGLIDKILRLDPSNRTARDARGLVRDAQRAEFRSRAMELAQRAQERFDAGDFETSITCAEDSISMDPDGPGVAKLLAEGRRKQADRRGANRIVDDVIEFIILAGPAGMMPLHVEKAYDDIKLAVNLDPRCNDALELRRALTPFWDEIQARKLAQSDPDREHTGRLIEQQIGAARIMRRKATCAEDYERAEVTLRRLPQMGRVLLEISFVVTDRKEFAAQQRAVRQAAALRSAGNLSGALAVLNDFADQYMKRASTVLKERKALEAALGIGVEDDPSAR